jgi:hypothetical protein
MAEDVDGEAGHAAPENQMGSDQRPQETPERVPPLTKDAWKKGRGWARSYGTGLGKALDRLNGLHQEVAWEKMRTLERPPMGIDAKAWTVLFNEACKAATDGLPALKAQAEMVRDIARDVAGKIYTGGDSKKMCNHIVLEMNERLKTYDVAYIVGRLEEQYTKLFLGYVPMLDGLKQAQARLEKCFEAMKSVKSNEDWGQQKIMDLIRPSTQPIGNQRKLSLMNWTSKGDLQRCDDILKRLAPYAQHNTPSAFEDGVPFETHRTRLMAVLEEIVENPLV